MATTTFSAAGRKEQVREQLDNFLAAFRDTLDAFVSNRMQRAAAEAGHRSTRNDRRALMSSDLLRRQELRPSAGEREGSGILLVEKPPTVSAQFRRLDPGIVNEAIPAFFIGRNKEGFWIARDVNGRIGGIFLLESSALSFARKNSRPAGCATIFLSERFELDLENNGNPLVAHLGPLMRLRRRTAAFSGKLTKATKRRLKDFQP